MSTNNICFYEENKKKYFRITIKYSSLTIPLHIQKNLCVAVMGDSSQLTPLSTIFKQPGPVIWFPLFLSFASPLSIASFAWKNLIIVICQ